AGILMASFQGVLVLSGNLSFLNWLTLIPILACFDDDAILTIVPKRPRAWLRAHLSHPDKRDNRLLIAAALVFGWLLLSRYFVDSVWIALAVIGWAFVDVRLVRWLFAKRPKLDGHQIAVACFAALVAVKSVPVIDNLTSHKQKMNRSYDRLELVNTYGA